MVPRDLLKRYMRHIISAEGISFIDAFVYEGALSEDDIKLLREIEAEIDA